MSHRMWGLSIAVLAAIGLAIWQPWRATELNRGASRTIVLFAIDTLRRDHVSVYTPDGERPPVRTPNIDAWAESGLRFDDARSPVPLTLPGHTTMLTGRPPAATGVRLNTFGRLRPPDTRGFPLLAERLQAAGWRTGAFVSAGVLAAGFGLDQGFDRYDDGDLGDTDALNVAERPGADTVDAAVRYAREAGTEQPLFLFVHIFEPHAPYTTGRYVDDVKAADAIFGRLRKGLRAAGRGDALILLTADHGEGLGNLGEASHGILLGDATLRVPFLLAGPGIPAGVRSDPADIADVAPTLAGLCGVPWPAVEGPGMGRDVMAGTQPPDRARVAESLYGHNRYGWAQLAAAVSPSGTLIDVGEGRAYWLERAAWRTEPVLQPAKAAQNLARLNQILVEYKELEVRVDDRGGSAPQYYGGSAIVEPFLPGPENARRPDPHEKIGLVSVLNQLALDVRAAQMRGDTQALSDLVRAAERITTNGDPTNPEAHFRLGEARRTLAGFDRPHLAAQAEQAFGRAWELGRKTSRTLVAWCGVNALGRDAAMLERLETAGKQLPHWTCQMWLLKAKILQKLGQSEAAEAACDAARKLCTTTRQQNRYNRVCR